MVGRFNVSVGDWVGVGDSVGVGVDDSVGIGVSEALCVAVGEGVAAMRASDAKKAIDMVKIAF